MHACQLSYSIRPKLTLIIALVQSKYSENLHLQRKTCEMNTIKLLLAVVVITTAHSNSSKVASASNGDAGNIPNREPEPNPPIQSRQRGRRSSRIPGINENECIPVPIPIFRRMRKLSFPHHSIFLKLIILVFASVRREQLSEREQRTLCHIVATLVIQNRTSRGAQSRAHPTPASADQVVPQPWHVERPSLTSVYCPPAEPTGNVAWPSAQGQSNLQGGGFHVRANQTNDGVEVLDENRQHVGTIEDNELCDAAENPSDANR